MSPKGSTKTEYSLLEFGCTMSWLKWYKSPACEQKQQEKWGDLTWTWNFLRPHKTKSWIVSKIFRCSLCPSSVLSSINHTYMIDNPISMALAASCSNYSGKKKGGGLFLKGFSNILVTNMLSFNNKHACFLVSCPSQNKRRACTTPGKKKKIKFPMYASSCVTTYVPHPRTVM